MSQLGFALLSILLHLAPVALLCCVDTPSLLTSAGLELGSEPSAPFEIQMVQREPEVEFIQALPEPAERSLPEAPLEFDADPLDLAPAPPSLPPPARSAQQISFLPEQPRRSAPEARMKLPALPPGENMPSVESETLPQQVYNPPPEYPLAARRQRLEGSVVVEVEVLEDGGTAGARIVRDCDVPQFAASALEAVRKWKFQPATRAGKPVRSLERVRFVFKLTGR